MYIVSFISGKQLDNLKIVFAGQFSKLTRIRSQSDREEFILNLSTIKMDNSETLISFKFCSASVAYGFSLFCVAQRTSFVRGPINPSAGMNSIFYLVCSF